MWLRGLKPTRLLCPWDFPGKNPGVGCHFLFQGIFPTQGMSLHFLEVSCIAGGFFTIWVTKKPTHWLPFSSVQFHRSVVSDSLRPHESQHARPPCPSSTHGVYPTHVHRVSDAIHPSHPLLSPSPPAFNLSQHEGLFKWVNSSHEVTKVLEFQL